MWYNIYTFLYLDLRGTSLLRGTAMYRQVSLAEAACPDTFKMLDTETFSVKIQRELSITHWLVRLANSILFNVSYHFHALTRLKTR